MTSTSVIEKLTQASDGTVRAILLALCDDRQVKHRAAGYLDRIERFEAESIRETETEKGIANPRKRKATGDLRICVQCSGVFTDDDNLFGTCSYHSGVLELWDETKIPAEKAWEDELDTESNRAAYPDAFRWCCCETFGDNEGCVRGRHEADPDLSKRGRGSESTDRDWSAPSEPADEAKGEIESVEGQKKNESIKRGTLD